MVAPTLFYSYAHKDEALRDQLEIHLVQLQRQGLIASWHDRKIPPGGAWVDEIDTHLETASIVDVHGCSLGAWPLRFLLMIVLCPLLKCFDVATESLHSDLAY